MASTQMQLGVTVYHSVVLRVVVGHDARNDEAALHQLAHVFHGGAVDALVGDFECELSNGELLQMAQAPFGRLLLLGGAYAQDVAQ